MPPWGLLINLAFIVSLLVFIRLTEYSSISFVSGFIAETNIWDVNPLGLYGFNTKNSDKNWLSKNGPFKLLEEVVGKNSCYY